MPRSDTATAFLNGDFGKSLLSDPRDKYFGHRIAAKGASTGKPRQFTRPRLGPQGGLVCAILITEACAKLLTLRRSADLSTCRRERSSPNGTAPDTRARWMSPVPRRSRLPEGQWRAWPHRSPDATGLRETLRLRFPVTKSSTGRYPFHLECFGSIQQSGQIPFRYSIRSRFSSSLSFRLNCVS